SSEPATPGSVASQRVASAIPRGFRASEPLKMTSSMVAPRRLLALCSPSTQVMASERLLLPQPLGPTIAVTPPANSTATGSTKDLKPEISSSSSFSMGELDDNKAGRAPQVVGEAERTATRYRGV